MIVPQNAFHYGRDIEEKAQIFLQKKGLHFLQKNVQIYGTVKKGEIDLIFLDKHDELYCELVFVEVRARSMTNLFGSAEESLSGLKRFHLKTSIEWFLRRNRNRLPQSLTGIRVDLLAWNGNRFNWMKNISL